MFRSKNKIILAVILLLLVGAVAYASLVLSRKLQKPPMPTSSPAYTQGQVRPQAPTSNLSQGGATDLNGSTTPQTPAAPTSGVSSASGKITLNSPGNNDTIYSGVTVRGISSLPSVQYRLVDDTVGVVAQGKLNVVDGKFSAILKFVSRGRTGKFEVFSYDPATGAEINSVRIIVLFGS